MNTFYINTGLSIKTFTVTLYISAAVIFFSGTPNFLNRFEHAIAEAPAPFITILIFLISFLAISKAFRSAADVIIAAVSYTHLTLPTILLV